MNDTKTRAITDINRLRAFGQNVELCAEIKGRTLESVAKGAQISTSLLSSFSSGEGGVLTADILEGLSLEFGLTCLELLGTHGTVERKTAVFKELFGMLPSTKVEVHDYDHSLMRMGRSSDGQIGRRNGDPIEEAAYDSKATEPVAEETVSTVQPIELAIEWGEDGYSAHCAGRFFEFKKSIIRRQVVQNIKVAKKSTLTATELTARLQPPKKASWISNLNNGIGELNREIIEQVARMCGVSVTFLLTGHEPLVP